MSSDNSTYVPPTQDATKNCRSYVEARGCEFEDTILAFNIVTLVLSFIGVISGFMTIIKMNWARNGQWKITEKMVILFTFYFLFRLAFFITLISGALDENFILLTILQNSCWIFVLIGCIVYVDNIITTIPNTPIGSTTNNDDKRRIHIYSILLSIFITISILLFGFLDGWCRAQGQDDYEMLMNRILNCIHTISLYMSSWLIWKYGRELGKRAKNRAEIMKQFPQRSRNHASFIIASAVESSPGAIDSVATSSRTVTSKPARHDAKQLRHSQFRLNTLNWALIVGGTVFGSVTLIYAITLSYVSSVPFLGLVFHFLLSVLATLTFLLMMIALTISVSYQREMEKARNDSVRRKNRKSTNPYMFDDQASVHTQNTMDLVEASKLSAAIATLQAEVRLEPLIIPEDSLAPSTQTNRYETMSMQESSCTLERRLGDDWMYGVAQTRNSMA